LERKEDLGKEYKHMCEEVGTLLSMWKGEGNSEKVSQENKGYSMVVV
jgi:hypothetical protein